MDESAIKKRLRVEHYDWDDWSDSEKERSIFETVKKMRYERADAAMLRAQRTLDEYGSTR